MLNLAENKSRIWFKVLTKEGEAIDGSSENWSLPHFQYKGDKLTFGNQQARCLNGEQWIEMKTITGTWIVSNPKELYPGNNNRKIFVVEMLSPPSYEMSGILWVDQVRLVREATSMDLKRFGIYRVFMPVIVDDS